MAELEITNARLIDICVEQQELIEDLDARMWKLVRLLKKRADQKQKRRS